MNRRSQKDDLDLGSWYSHSHRIWFAFSFNIWFVGICMSNSEVLNETINNQRSDSSVPANWNLNSQEKNCEMIVEHNWDITAHSTQKWERRESYFSSSSIIIVSTSWCHSTWGRRHIRMMKSLTTMRTKRKHINPLPQSLLCHSSWGRVTKNQIRWQATNFIHAPTFVANKQVWPQRERRRAWKPIMQRHFDATFISHFLSSPFLHMHTDEHHITNFRLHADASCSAFHSDTFCAWSRSALSLFCLTTRIVPSICLLCSMNGLLGHYCVRTCISYSSLSSISTCHIYALPFLILFLSV